MSEKEKGIPQLALGIEPKEQMQQLQRLMMSAQMQQALQLLQVPLLELDTFLEEQIVANPILQIGEEDEERELSEEKEQSDSDVSEQEIILSDQDYTLLKYLEEEYQDLIADTEPPAIKRSAEEDKKKAYLESSICAEKTLYEQLIEQIHQTFDREEDQMLAELLIGYFDSSGFLTTPLEEIALLHQVDAAELKRLLTEIQTFEPYGVGAANIQDSFLIQLHCLQKQGSLAYQIIEQCYDDLLHNKLPSIQKKVHCTMEALRDAIENDIAKLDLHPGTHYSTKKNPMLVPDVTLRQEGEELVIDVNREHAGRLHLNPRYLKLLDNPDIPVETKDFIKKHMLSAKWLVRNLHHRYSTIERIAQSLAKRQHHFFTQPTGQLVPLTMKAVAEELGLHESTIARTVSNKYIACPRGLLPLRAFFTSGYISEDGKDVSSRTVRDALIELIAKEDKRHPYSDEDLSKLLKEQGLSCARRTIAKYRLELGIGNTLQRKKY